MKKIRAFVLAVGVSAVVGVHAWAAGWTIVPGSSVGPLALGASWKTCDALLHRDDKDAVIQDAAGVHYARYKEGIDLHVDRGNILEIIVKSPTSMTVEGGIKVGATVNQMEAAFGRSYTAQALKVAKSQAPETYYAYTSRGIGFIARSGVIYQIAVWPKKN